MYLFSEVSFQFQTEGNSSIARFFFSLRESLPQMATISSRSLNTGFLVVTVTHLHPYSGLCAGAKIYTFLAGTAHSCIFFLKV